MEYEEEIIESIVPLKKQLHLQIGQPDSESQFYNLMVEQAASEQQWQEPMEEQWSSLDSEGGVLSAAD